MRDDLWTCPRCARQFANVNQSHSCGPYTVARFLADKSPAERNLYEAFAAAVHACGPVTEAPAKTRIGFQARMIFAAVNSLKGGELHAHVVLKRKITNPRFTKIEEINPRCWVHHFAIRSADEIDEDIRSWLRESYQTGEQVEVRKRKKPSED